MSNDCMIWLDCILIPESIGLNFDTTLRLHLIDNFWYSNSPWNPQQHLRIRRTLQSFPLSEQRRHRRDEPKATRRKERQPNPMVIHQPGSHLDIRRQIVDGRHRVSNIIDNLVKDSSAIIVA